MIWLLVLSGVTRVQSWVMSTIVGKFFMSVLRIDAIPIKIGWLMSSTNFTERVVITVYWGGDLVVLKNFVNSFSADTRNCLWDWCLFWRFIQQKLDWLVLRQGKMFFKWGSKLIFSMKWNLLRFSSSFVSLSEGVLIFNFFSEFSLKESYIRDFAIEPSVAGCRLWQPDVQSLSWQCKSWSLPPTSDQFAQCKRSPKMKKEKLLTTEFWQKFDHPFSN